MPLSDTTIRNKAERQARPTRRPTKKNFISSCRQREASYGDSIIALTESKKPLRLAVIPTCRSAAHGLHKRGNDRPRLPLDGVNATA